MKPCQRSSRLKTPYRGVLEFECLEGRCLLDAGMGCLPEPPHDSSHVFDGERHRPSVHREERFDSDQLAKHFANIQRDQPMQSGWHPRGQRGPHAEHAAFADSQNEVTHQRRVPVDVPRTAPPLTIARPKPDLSKEEAEKGPPATVKGSQTREAQESKPGVSVQVPVAHHRVEPRSFEPNVSGRPTITVPNTDPADATQSTVLAPPASPGDSETPIANATPARSLPAWIWSPASGTIAGSSSSTLQVLSAITNWTDQTDSGSIAWSGSPVPRVRREVFPNHEADSEESSQTREQTLTAEELLTEGLAVSVLALERAVQAFLGRLPVETEAPSNLAIWIGGICWVGAAAFALQRSRSQNRRQLDFALVHSEEIP